MKKDVFAVVSEQNPKFKPVNQDCAFAGPITNSTGTRMHVVAVADGISGASHGEKASLMAITAFCKFLAGDTSNGAHQLAKVAHPFFIKVNRDIAEIGDGGSGTTFTAMVLFKKRSILLHIGDSRAYFLSDGQCKVLTTDHTEVAEAREQGVNEDEIALMHQHALTKCLGIDADCEPDIIVSPLSLGEKEGTLLLTTDGVHDVLSGSHLITLAKEHEDLNEFCQAIVKDALVTPTAKGKANRDNITMAVVRVPLVNKQENNKGLLLPLASSKRLKIKPLYIVPVLLFVLLGLMLGGYYAVSSLTGSAEVATVNPKLNHANSVAAVSSQPLPSSVIASNEVQSIKIVDEKGTDFSVSLFLDAVPEQLHSSQVEPEGDDFSATGFRIYYDIKGIAEVSSEAQAFLHQKNINHFPGLTAVDIYHHQDGSFLRIVIRGSDPKVLGQGITNKTDKEFSIRFVAP